MAGLGKPPIMSDRTPKIGDSWGPPARMTSIRMS
jgi:hypothetical protein